MRRRANVPALVSLVACALSSGAAAEGLVGLTTDNVLLSFDSATPGVIQGTAPITGLVAGDSVVGIDRRPATGVLYGLGVNGTTAHLYTLDATTGVATQLGGNITLPLSPGVVGAETSFGIDFNPTVDRIRVVAVNRDNFRLNPNTGSVAATDTALSPGTPAVVGVAYDRNTATATLTTLFGIDSTTDQLVRIGGVDSVPSPNGGVVTAIGSLGVDTGSEVGFDISPSGTAYATLTVGGLAGLYTVNLTTGAATLVGQVGVALAMRDVAVSFGPPPALPSEMLVGLVSGSPQRRGPLGEPPADSLVRFDSTNPGTILATIPITGTGLDTIRGIDARPLTGVLYGLGVNGTVAHLYTINITTGAAVQVGGDINLPQSTGTSGSGTAFGFDFNPTVDRIRVVANNRDNFRLDPATGAVAGVDTALSPAGVTVVGVAYDRNFVGTPATTLYGIDSTADQVVTIGGIDSVPSPNGGVVTNVLALGLDTGNEVGFDISPGGNGWATLTVLGVTRLYRITPSPFTMVGPVGANLALRDVAVLLPLVPVELMRFTAE